MDMYFSDELEWYDNGLRAFSTIKWQGELPDKGAFWEDEYLEPGNYGFIDRKGNVVIEPKYVYVIGFDQRRWGGNDAFKKALKRDTQFARLADNPNKMTVFQNFMEQTYYIYKVLRFPTREAMLDKISIKFVFNDISDENLNDSDFVAILEKYKIEPRKYSTGYKEKYNDDGLSSDN